MKNTLSSWADRFNLKRRDVSSDQRIQKAASKLVRLQEQKRLLSLQERRLRDSLGLMLENGDYAKVVDNDKTYIVELSAATQGTRLNTEKTLAFVREHYGPDAARQVAQECAGTPTRPLTVYVRPFHTV